METDFKYSLSIVAIMKQEELNVLEWVAYHHVIGVDHFYIYSNDEDPSEMRRVLAKYIDSGVVTLNHAPGPVMMFKCYNRAIADYKDESKYIAFIDADEYIMPIEDRNLFEVIDETISKYRLAAPNISGLAMKWTIYGSGNYKTRPEGLIIENYIYRENGSFDGHVKTVVNPRTVSTWINPHFPMYLKPHYSIDESGLSIFGPFLREEKRNKIRINHYYYKSEEEFMNRVKKGKCDIRITEQQMEAFVNDQLEALRASNKDYDDTMLRYVDRVKEEIQKYS